MDEAKSKIETIQISISPSLKWAASSKAQADGQSLSDYICGLIKADTASMPRLSYDYSEFLQEMEEELADGTLTKTDIIQILRSKEDRGGYFPIIDWTYDKERMDAMMDELEEDEKAAYLAMLPDLTEVTVENFLIEIKDIDKLF